MLPNDRRAAPEARQRRGRPWLHLCAVGVPLALVLFVGALFGMRLWLDGFLHGADFRQFLERKTSALLRVQTRLEPLQWQGGSVYSDALDGAGNPGSPWTRLSAEQIRAELNLRALWHGVWRIETIELGSARAVLGSDSGRPEVAAPTSTAPETGVSPEGSPLAKLLPNRVEIGRIYMADLSLFWGQDQPASSGRLQGAELTAEPRQDGNGWDITGRKGRLEQARLPALDLEQFNLKLDTHALSVTRASAGAQGGGHVDFTGNQQLDGDKNLAIDAAFDSLPSESFLPADWRARIHGLGTGEVHITGSPSAPDGWHANGHVDLHEGRVEALPVLDEIAVFTATARFRQAVLQKGSADFDWRPGMLAVTNLRLESEGLIRVEGGFTVRGEQIDGRLHVGVASGAGRLLAGVGARVFNEPERDGYLWTGIQLSGSVHNPHEDLSARLVQATQEEVLQKTQQGAASVLDTASGLLNILRSP